MMDSFRCILYVYKRTLLRAHDDGKKGEKPVAGASGGGEYQGKITSGLGKNINIDVL